MLTLTSVASEAAQSPMNRQQRRAMERRLAKEARRASHQPLVSPKNKTEYELRRAGHYTVLNGISHATITRPAFDHLKSLLEQRGNHLAHDHGAALYALVGTMTEMAMGKVTGRWAFGLPTGTGKTTAIVTWCAALIRRGVDHIGVAVSASKVEALCELKRELIAQGVPADRVGLIHSKRYDPNKVAAVRRGDREADSYASEPSEGEDRQIMLVTHQRVRGCKLDSFNLYRGKPRGLLLYDESLIVSDSLGIPVNLLKGAVAWLEATRSHKPEHAPLIAYLTECRDRIVSALATADDTDANVTISLPDRSPEEVESYRAMLGSHQATDAASHLLDLAQETIRVIPTGQGGVVWYNVSVPPEIKNILVLDASQPIRKLVHLDPTIRDAEKYLPGLKWIGVPLSHIKRFDRVTIRQLFAGGGRETMRNAFAPDRVEDRRVSRAIIDVVQNSVAPTEAVLIFTYKTRPDDRTKSRRVVDYRDILLRDLREAGMDTQATVDTPQGPRPRINVVTWGMETSTNDYDHCAHVILAGVMQRSPVDLAAAYLGQTDRLDGDVIPGTIRELQASESCHLIYQALSRGRCRKVDNGEALPMTGWIIHRDDAIRRELEKVLPGAKWEVWETDHFAASVSTIATLAHRIGDTLSSLAEDVDRISTRKLKGLVEGGREAASETWRLALHRALDRDLGWRIEARSLARIGSEFSAAT